jgi:hypothetical protein
MCNDLQSSAPRPDFIADWAMATIPEIKVVLLFQKIDIGKFDRDFWHGPVLSEL